jgi:hypothetical protein
MLGLDLRADALYQRLMANMTELMLNTRESMLYITEILA